MNNNNLHVLNLSAYEAPEVVETKKDEWVTYGKNNDYYNFLIDRYKNSATNNAIINNISKFVFGKGLSATDANRRPNEYAQLVTLLDPEELKKVILDFKMLGQGAFQIHYTKNHKKIAKVYHMPIQLLAPEKCNEKGEIEGYYYSDNWEDIKKYPPNRIPAFGSSNKEVEILCFKNYTVGMKYFGCVDYVGALAYCTLEEEISDYLINEVQNGFSGTKVVNFNNGIPTEEQQNIISNKVMGKLTGSHGQKVIVAFNSDETSKTTIDDIQLNDAPDHYSYLSEECMRKIMLGHNVTSPLLFGIAGANGFSSNADELKNSSILFENMVIKPIQGVLINAIDKILAFNKISLKLYFKTLQPLQFKDLEGYEVEEEKETSYSFAKEDSHMVNLLTAFGEEVPEDWLLVSESEVDYDSEDQLDEIIETANQVIPEKSILSKIVDLVSQGRKSKQDITVENEIGEVKFFTRYRYAGETNEKSREFCKKMIERNLMYRSEDIKRMKNSAVNKGWGPKGAATYDIWLYKGGGSCRHRWNREVYAQFPGQEIDITDPKVRNIAQRKLKQYGYDPKKGVLKNPAKVSQRPRDMKNRGFLEPKNFTTPL